MLFENVVVFGEGFEQIQKTDHPRFFEKQCECPPFFRTSADRELFSPHMCLG